MLAMKISIAKQPLVYFISLLKEHQQISKKRCFQKYCSCGKACQFLACQGIALIELFRKPNN